MISDASASSSPLSLLLLKTATVTVMPQSHWGRRYYGLSRSLPVIPVHGPGWTGWKWRFFAEKSRRSTDEALKDPGAPRGTPVHPGRVPAGPRFIPALTRFTPVLGPVLHGSPRSMPAEPRWRYGSSRFSTAELRSFPVHPGEVKMQYK